MSTRPIDPAIAAATAPRMPRGLPVAFVLVGASIGVSAFGEAVALALPLTAQPSAYALQFPIAFALAGSAVISARGIFGPSQRRTTLRSAGATLGLLALACALAWSPLLALAGVPETPGLHAAHLPTAASLAVASAGLVLASLRRRVALPSTQAAVAAVERQVQQASDRLKAISDRLTVPQDLRQTT